MAKQYYDNSDPGMRFQPGTAAEAEAVDQKFDGVQYGLEKVEQDTRRALKVTFEPGMDDLELESTLLQRRNKLIGFNGKGNPTLLSQAILGLFEWRGDWSSCTKYNENDIFRDPDSKNLYVVNEDHVSVSVKDDEASGLISLALSHSQLHAGEVTTVDYGQPAEVDIYGSPGDQFADFKIPEGKQGERGPRGVPGSQVILNIVGESATTDGLPTNANPGDAWLVDTQVYLYNAGRWQGPVLDYNPQVDPKLDVRRIYVSKAGNDDNTGTSLKDSVLTIERALQLANDHPEPVVVGVEPGDYIEKGELPVKDNSAVVSTAGQYVTNVIAAPGFEETNMFLVGSGSYVQGFTFRDQQVDDFDDPHKGFAVAFRPGARIMRSPYIRDSSQVSNYDANAQPQPLDPANGNPLVGRGGGMLLADRAVISQHSAFPYMLAFGATPRTPNGLGYVARNGAGINGISSLTIFARCGFYALDGGQITLNNSGTQFGDISMRAKGSKDNVEPESSSESLVADSAAADAISAASQSIIDEMWTELQQAFPGETSQPGFEEATRRDAKMFLESLEGDLRGGTETLMQSFVLGLFDYKAEKVYNESLEAAFIFSWKAMRDIIKRDHVAESSECCINGLVDLVVRTIENPTIVKFSSLVESLSHQFNNAGAGVNRLALPLNFRQPGFNRPVQFSVLEEDGGRVRWSGADEKNIQYFGDDFRIDGRTGRVYGRAFNRTVRQIARRMANTRIF